MSIIEKIYESYIAGELTVKPKNTSPEIREKLTEIEEQFGISGDDADEFENDILDLFDGSGKTMFFAGFVTAAKLNAEISAKP